jgi:hypothetical protein
VAYTREELDWIEAEWAFHLHGRSAFLSREDFLQVTAWEGEAVPAEAVVAAMDTFFGRRAKRARPRAFVAMSHLAKDVAKAAQLRLALARGEETAPAGGKPRLDGRLAKDPKAVSLFEGWQRLRASTPAPDSPAYLDHFDALQAARQAFIAQAANHLGSEGDGLRLELSDRLQAAGIREESPVWKRAFGHHWGKMVLEAFGIGDA